jgi:hypothetical protein
MNRYNDGKQLMSNYGHWPFVMKFGFLSLEVAHLDITPTLPSRSDDWQ